MKRFILTPIFCLLGGGVLVIFSDIFFKIRKLHSVTFNKGIFSVNEQVCVDGGGGLNWKIRYVFCTAGFTKMVPTVYTF